MRSVRGGVTWNDWMIDYNCIFERKFYILFVRDSFIPGFRRREQSPDFRRRLVCPKRPHHLPRKKQSRVSVIMPCFINVGLRAFLKVKNCITLWSRMVIIYTSPLNYQILLILCLWVLYDSRCKRGLFHKKLIFVTAKSGAGVAQAI
jgi:hypothetical protein